LVRSLVRVLFRRQDPMSRDIGQSGELLTARLRMVLIAVLAINPVKSLIFAPSVPVNWVGVCVAIGAVAIAFLVLGLASRERPPRILPLFTSQFDTFVVSLASVGFIVAGNPIVATNSFVHWTYYLLAIGATCLRHDPRVTVLALVSAVAQLLAIALYVAVAYPGLKTEEYGTFDWDTQIGKAIALVVMGLLALAIVARNRQVWETSVKDKLTGLHNRRFFDDILEFKCFESERDGRPFCLALIDVDHFKKINDTRGHDVGDLVLQQLGRSLAGEFRTSDIPARWGGEEFAIIFPETDLVEAARRLEAFRQEVAGQIHPFPITVSVGLASYPRDAGSPQALVVAADRRLLEAKRTGRNRLVSA